MLLMTEFTAAVLLLKYLGIGCSTSEKSIKENLEASIEKTQLQRLTCENNSFVCPSWAFCDATTRACQCKPLNFQFLKNT